MVQVGRWTASRGGIRQEERWRIHDGGWYVDVMLDQGVDYQVAARIVSAIRRRTLVNRPDYGNDILNRLLGKVPDVRPEDIRMIRKTRPPEVGLEVQIGHYAGHILYVRVVDGRVELYRCSTWIT
jgi:hypothetical protein